MQVKDVNELRQLVDDLYWDYDRMSSSGKETLDRMDQIVGATTDKEENKYGVQ